MPPSKPAAVLIGVVVALAAAVAAYTVVSTNVRGPERPPTSDMDEFAKTDPSLLKYAETQQVRTRFKEARAVAVGPSDRIYVAGDDRVRVFDSTGRHVRDIATSSVPRCLAVAKDGTVYVGAMDRVEVYPIDPARRSSWDSAGDKAIFTSIAVTEEHVLVADAGNREILRYDPAGKLIERIRKKDPTRDIDGVMMPSAHFDVVVGVDGLIRANDPGRLCVDVYTSQGELLESWGKGGPEIDRFIGCCNPVRIAALPDGSIVTSEKGFPRVKVYTREGRFNCVVAGTESFVALRCPTAGCTSGNALDLAVDSRGRVLVLDPATRQVRIFVRKTEPKR